MKKSLVRVIPLLIAICLFGCKKNHSGSFTPALTITATSTTNGSQSIRFPTVVVAVQEVDTLHSTLISGQYSDTSTLQGSISIRVIGDTTGTYKGNKLLVTYVDGLGNTYNSQGDSTDQVTITRFSKQANGEVTGSFFINVYDTPNELTLSGQFTAGFLD
ncbi:MAG TPA: hypothetical protein VL547_21420 [Dinghuibacter sp.]|uniref:hypothetical protein n=1 Tax=Dinghuibacter sp. TaxID=2024697 RepID=UPI002D159A5F|nr:hypothetical protein [Dinghuibacter sp.]HTJ14620.1 hypothetical protein [Dinghuibacter sp.]